VKQGIRALGIDDGPLAPQTLLVGVIMRRDRFEGLLSTRVSLDGEDATGKIIEMVRNSKFASQLHVVFINGVAVAGFNLVNYVKISRELGVPVIAVTPNEPHPEEMEKVVKKWKGKREIWEEIRRPAIRMETEKGSIWYQHAGADKRKAERLIKHFLVHSKIPEPLRIAHIIAAGIELGESRGL